MDNIRRAIATFSIVAILSSFVVSTAFAGTFTDVKEGTYYYDAVEALVEAGTIPGTVETYNPGGGLTRALAAKYVVEGAGWEVTTHDTATFKDVPKTHSEFDLIETAVDHEFMKGSGAKPGYFLPTDTVNRAEYAKMSVLAFELETYEPEAATFTDVKAADWFYSYVETAAHYGVVKGKTLTTFAPGEAINRADGAVMTVRAISAEAPAEGEGEGEGEGEEVTGDLEVALSDDNPTPGTLPSGATSIPVATWDFTAGDGGSTLDSLEVHTYGVTSLPTTHNLYLYEGSERLTSGKSVNGTTNIATFNNLNLGIDEGETRTFTLKLSTGTVTTASEAAFELVDAEAVDAGESEVTGDFPLRAGVWSLSTVTAGTVTIEKNGTISNPKVGEDDAIIAKFKIGAATETANLEEIGLLLAGTISATDVENFELYVSGETDPIATVDATNAKDLMVFTLDESYVITKGETKSFWVQADFNTGRSADTVFVYVDETTDVVAIGDTYGYGMTVTINTATTGYDGTTTACSASAGTCSYSTLQGGDITVTSGGPTAATIGIGADDIHLMDFSIVSIADVTFKNFPIYLQTSGYATAAKGLLASATVSNFTDIKIVNTDTGETLMGPIDADNLYSDSTWATALTVTTDTSAGLGYYVFTDEFDMDTGEELNLALTTDVYNAAALDAETIYGVLDFGNASNYPTIKDVNNKTVTNSSSLVPNSDISSKTMTVGSPSLTTSLAATPVAGATTNNPNTYVLGQKDVKFVGISTTCGTASTCRITDMTLTGYLDEGNDGTFAAGTETSLQLNSYVGSVWVEDGDGNEVAAAQSVAATTGLVTYDNISYEMDAGETEVFYVMGNLSTNATASDNATFSLATGGITFEDDDGSSRTSTGAVNGTTAPTTYISVSAGGSLTIATDSASPKEDILIAGTSGNEVSKFKFTTTDEAFIVKALSVSAKQADGTALGDVAAADLGAYDNNIASITLSYTNSSGVTETKTGYLTSGNAQFTGMNFSIDKNSDAVLTASATLNTVANGAQAGEFVELNIAYNNFEAVAQSSGVTYKADKLDEQTVAASDLDFGTMTFVDTTVTHAATADAVTLGSSATLTVPDLNVSLPVGTFVKFGAESTTYAEGTDILVVLTTKYTDGDLTLTGFVANNDDGDANGNEIYYALPGHAWATETKQMHVYETKPTVTLNASSPSGSKSVATSDNAFVFDITAGSQEKVQFRTGKDLTSTCLTGFDTGDDNTVDAAYATTAIDSSGCQAVMTNVVDHDSVAFDGGATGDIATYARMSFWMYWSEADDDGDPLFADFYTGTDGTGDAGAAGSADNNTVLAASDCTFQGAATATTLTTATWYYCDVAIHTSTDSSDEFWHFEIHDVDAAKMEAADIFVLDRVIAYNDKINVDIAGDDIDTYANIRTNAANGTLPAYLKEGGDTLATGYVYKNTSAAAEGGTAGVTFIPISGTDSAIEISKNATRTFTLQLSTSALLAEDASADDPLTFSMDLGTASNGTISAGDIWWNDTNFSATAEGAAPGTSYALATPGVIKWLGKVTNTTFSGNTVKY